MMFRPLREVNTMFEARERRLRPREQPEYVAAVVDARYAVGSAIGAARAFGFSGFILAYHQQTLYAEKTLKGVRR